VKDGVEAPDHGARAAVLQRRPLGHGRAVAGETVTDGSVVVDHEFEQVFDKKNRTPRHGQAVNPFTRTVERR
jgi:hypothetical protein